MKIDGHGNLHDRSGRFAEKPHSAPSGGLDGGDDDELARAGRMLAEEEQWIARLRAAIAQYERMRAGTVYDGFRRELSWRIDEAEERIRKHEEAAAGLRRRIDELKEGSAPPPHT